RSPYAITKLLGEYYCRFYHDEGRVPTACLRLFNVFGPRQDPNSQYAAVVPRFITALLRGAGPTVYGDGRQSRDFTYIDNVVQANWDAAYRGPGKGEAVNVACGDRLSLLDLLALLGEIIGASPSPEFLPARAGDVLHSQASIDRARALWGFRPIVTVQEGMARTVEHFRRTTG
ncbi:MAG: NAD-dependent epimerase/dehydratase family protein, partial [bacterium]